MSAALPLLALLSVAAGGGDEAEPERDEVVAREGPAARAESDLSAGSAPAPTWGDSHGLSVYLESAAIFLAGASVEYRYAWFAVRANVAAGLVSEPPVLAGGSAFALLFEGDHHLELGLTLGHFTEEGSSFIAAPSVGYRYQAPTGGVLLRAGAYGANIQFFGDRRWFPVPQVSFGYAF